MKYHALFVIFEKAANLKLSSAANYRVALYGLTLSLLAVTLMSPDKLRKQLLLSAAD